MSPVSSSSPAVRHQSKRRVLTPARKEQNRLAQKVYRQRQKERREKRPQPATSREQPPTLRPKGDTLTREATEVPTWTNTSGNVPNSDLVMETLDEWVALVDPQGSFEQCLSEVQLPTPPLPNPPTGSSLLHPLQSDDPFLYGGDIRSINSNMAVSLHSPTSCEVIVEDSTAKTTSTRGTNPYNSDGSRSDPSRLPCPEANARQMVHTTIFSAMLQNALALGFDLLELSACTTTSMSPFYRADAQPQDHPGQLTSEALAQTGRDVDAVPAGLRPTLAQVLIPHHASLDLIPFPQFRDRIIMLSAGLPHLFNLWELKMDIYVHGALVVSPSARRSGTCQPWNWKSWEAAPWFLRKWSMAVNSEQGRQVTELS